MAEYKEHKIDDSYALQFAKENKLLPMFSIGGFKYMCNGAKCEIDNKIKRRVDHDLKAVSNEWDLVYGIAGMEGSGKSKGIALTVATYICFRLCKPFSLNNIVFTPEQFYKFVDDAKPFDVLFWDEFILGGSSDDTLGNIQRALKKKFTIIRSKQLIIILVIPYFHMMSKYWAISRTRALIDCISPDGIERGEANFYGYAKKRYAYIHGKKIQTLEPFKKDFSIKFLDLGNIKITGKDIIDWDAYEKKKQDSTKEIENKKEKQNILLLKYRNALQHISKNLKADGWTIVDIAKLTDEVMSVSAFKEWGRAKTIADLDKGQTYTNT